MHDLREAGTTEMSQMSELIVPLLGMVGMIIIVGRMVSTIVNAQDERDACIQPSKPWPRS